ncbi:MAG: acetate--CoA ligase family protein [Dehalococcoidia bacterium]|nr:acetate--CoA ligase family protein [Dehalococcoidia bacterium]
MARSETESTTRVLTEVESKQMLKAGGVPVVDTRLAVSKADAVAISKEIGFPVALKIMSADVVHKSDAGGVKLALQDAAAVEKAWDDIMDSILKAYPEAKIDGVSVQGMARPGVEVIVGMSKDPQFGPVLMFGLGGILVELLKDVSFRIVPVSKMDADEMIHDIKGFPMLQGFRGAEPADLDALEKVIVAVSDFVEANPKIKELDLNPVFANKDGAIAVDARIVIED